MIFSRQITPDPAAPERMVVSVLPAGDRYGGRLQNQHQVCAELVGGRYPGGGCWPAGRLFSTAPFSWSVNQHDQYVTIAGLASDDVARLALYLATGDRVAVPLHDNGYMVEAARAAHPLRLVAYDSQERVIGVTTFKGDLNGPRGPQPVPNANWRTIVRNQVGEVLVAPSTNGRSCYASRLRTGAGTLSCPPPLTRSGLEVSVSSGPGAVTLTGRAGRAIARIVVRFRDGHKATVTPHKGYLLATIPHPSARTGPARTIDSIVGLDASGREIAQQTFTELVGGSGVIHAITPEAITIGEHDVPAHNELAPARRLPIRSPRPLPLRERIPHARRPLERGQPLGRPHDLGQRADHRHRRNLDHDPKRARARQRSRRGQAHVLACRHLAFNQPLQAWTAGAGLLLTRRAHWNQPPSTPVISGAERLSSPPPATQARRRVQESASCRICHISIRAGNIIMG